MVAVIKIIFQFGALIFGVGFLAPLIAQSVAALGWQPPFGLTPLVFGLITGTALGALAQMRGRWI